MPPLLDRGHLYIAEKNMRTTWRFPHSFAAFAFFAIKGLAWLGLAALAAANAAKL